MPKIRYEGQDYVLEGDETVLDCLLRHGVSVSYGCKAGACQSCLMQATDGALPSEAQRGLKDTQKFDKYFLSCLCRPHTDLEAGGIGGALKSYTTSVIGVERLNADIARLRLGLPAGFRYRAGQFINLVGPGGTLRSYSLASVPELDDFLELHIQRVPAGLVSNWVHDELKPNDTLTISAAMGQCFYVPVRHDQPLLLIGTGSGLAPLYGIARDAIHQGHSGPIHLYHGSSRANGIYYVEELHSLAERHEQLNYTPTVSRAHELPKVASGRANEKALKTFNKLDGWRVFLCGHPEMVNSTRTSAFLAGADMQDIYADPFTFSQRAPVLL